MTYEFQSILHRTRKDMLAAIASEWLTGGGINSTGTVIDMTKDGMTAEAAAAECIEGWSLDQADSLDDRPSHMGRNGYTADDLTEAMRQAMAPYTDAAALSPLDAARLDLNLTAEMDAPVPEWTTWEFPILDRDGVLTGRSYQVVYHAGSQRGGIVLVGSGASGLTAWTDAVTPGEVLVHYLTDDMQP